MLTPKDLKRYDRQIKLLGEAGQEKLKRAKVFIAGAGGLRLSHLHLLDSRRHRLHNPGR